MSIIDAHVHLYPPELNSDPVAWGASRSETHWAILCTRRRKSGQPVQVFPSVDELLHAMDTASVERAVLQGWYWQWPETCEWQNAFFAQCVKEHPDRLSAFGSLHPAKGREATLDMVRRVRDSGLAGLGELSPHSQGYDVGDPAFVDAIELAGDLRMPVCFHVTDRESRDYPGRIETPLRDFLWLARNFPHTNMILAHWGGLLPFYEKEWDALFNIYFDTAASPLLYDKGIWSRFLNTVPVERLLFGSDYPLNLYPGIDPEPLMNRFIEEAKINGADLDQMAKNARLLLHLPSH